MDLHCALSPHPLVPFCSLSSMLATLTSLFYSPSSASMSHPPTFALAVSFLTRRAWATVHLSLQYSLPVCPVHSWFLPYFPVSTSVKYLYLPVCPPFVHWNINSSEAGSSANLFTTLSCGAWLRRMLSEQLLSECRY